MINCCVKGSRAGLNGIVYYVLEPYSESRSVRIQTMPRAKRDLASMQYFIEQVDAKNEKEVNGLQNVGKRFRVETLIIKQARSTEDQGRASLSKGGQNIQFAGPKLGDILVFIGATYR